uniref:Anion exchange protein n=1 Tax=Clastoptera arizonana TaxID=38151 RepID=A0A1B6DDV8_9HEMI
MAAPRRKSMLARIGIRGDRDGGQAGPDLDEEMEKVFAMSEGERFDLARFSKQSESPPNPEQRRYDEKDYSFHRKKSYPHMHVPIKIMHPRSMRKRTSPRDSHEGSENVDSRKNSQSENEPELKSSLPQNIPQSASTSPEQVTEEAYAEEGLLSSESDPIVSDRAAELPGSYSASPDRKVQFDIDDLHETVDEDEEDDISHKTPVEEKEKKGIRKQSESSVNFSSPDLEDVGHGDYTTHSSESEAHVSDRETNQFESTEYVISPDRRVQFDMEADEEDEYNRKMKDDSDDGVRKGKRKHGRYKLRKYSMPDETVWRKRSGAFLDSQGRKFSIQPEEASTLQEMDQDDLASHRFDIPRDKRRFSVKSKISVVSMGSSSRKSSVAPQGLPIFGYKKAFDHSPHKVFVQLNELIGFGDDQEWKETARWIKYEENVEEGADRWGRPHVASLSFHSLLNLRRCLSKGVVLLDLEEKDLPGIAYRVVEQMVVDELIMTEDKALVMRALLLRHRHVDSERFRFNVRRNTASYTSLQNLQEEAKSKPKIVTSGSSLEVPRMYNNHHFDEPVKLNLLNHTTVEMKEETYMSSSEDLTKKAAKESIMKRIPSGAEATTVLVGAVDFLKQPTIAFVRLAEGILIPSITEVPLPVRFLFILMGPLTAELDYHEIGRSISTLMSIADFHTLAYKATERSDLLIAINEFLDYSIVLPPGDWQTKALLPFAELKAKTEAIRRRQSRVQDAAKLETKAPLIEGEREKKPPYPDPLKRTKRPYGGLVNDIKRRFPFYISDIIDGVNAQCFAAAIFIYFAALSAAITFGGLMADKTNNLVGISETLLATSGAGIIFSLLAGQPLVIVGTTGPLLLFDESLYNFCQSNGIEYLTIRVYIGFWLAIIALVVAFFEGSVFVKLFTRFISEIFASLISLLYIMESAQKVYLVFIKHPLMTLSEYCSKENITNIMYSVAMLQATPINSTDSTSDFNSDLNNTLTSVPSKKSTVVLNEPNTALFCLILALGTFFIAYYLRQFRNSKFLGRSARRALGDFGVPIAIVMMVFGDYIVPGIYTEKLKVPEGLSPSNPVIRGWIISPLGLVQPFQLWVALAASIPAILVYILLFMETHISELIIDKKDRKLKKGSGFHLDIVLICLINVGSGLIGAPFMCAATVRSVAHVSAVTVMSRTHAPGDKPHIIEVKGRKNFIHKPFTRNFGRN